MSEQRGDTICLSPPSLGGPVPAITSCHSKGAQSSFLRPDHEKHQALCVSLQVCRGCGNNDADPNQTLFCIVKNSRPDPDGTFSFRTLGSYKKSIMSTCVLKEEILEQMAEF